MEKHEMERVLELQRKAYELLMWINAQAASQPDLLSEESVHSLNYAASCRAWIEHRAGSFPQHLRVEAGDLDAFAHLLSAFFSTSFRVEEKQHSLRTRSGYGWETETRRRLVSGTAGKKSRAAREKIEVSAQHLQLIALEELAIERDVDLPHAQLQVLVEREDLQPALALWSYGHELARRSKFASQGAAVHSLWRVLDDTARANLKADDLWAARQVLVDALLDALQQA